MPAGLTGMRPIALLAAAACAFAQAPRFGAGDVRPQGSAEPRPLLPGIGIWIFGENLGPNCAVTNAMDPATYKTELCGVRVLFGDIPARLLYTSPGQINLIAPDHPWENEMVNVQVIHEGGVSVLVPVRFGVDRPILSVAGAAFAGMPVWIHVEMPVGRGSPRYPHWTVPWDLAPGRFEVRFEGRDLAALPQLPMAPPIPGGRMVGLPHEPAAKFLRRAPLHLLYALDRPGTYEVRYTETRFDPGARKETLYQQSEWTRMEVQPATAGQRLAWLAKLAASPPSDPVELIADYLPSLLAVRNETVLRILARYLDASDPVLSTYARYALNYFDPALLHRIVPGREPLRGFVL